VMGSLNIGLSGFVSSRVEYDWFISSLSSGLNNNS
jgi:hypothetical protein